MSENGVKYSFDRANRFVVENYNWAKSFSNFFPGIAGKWGVPIWCYYVSRAQGICSMGVANKDHQIMEFLSFNKAVASVGKAGFRTFIKLGDGTVYEPFQKCRNPKIKQKLIVSSGELEILESNSEVGIETRVIYYPLVGTRTPALVRELLVKNISGGSLNLELVDGLPHVFPYGVDINIIQTIPRHIEGMIMVADYKGVPLFRLKQTPADVEQVDEVKGGNFWLSEGRTIVDPAVLFGEAENYDYPWNFADMPLAELMEKKQIRQNRTPCAFTGAAISLKSDEEKVVHSLLGFVERDDRLDSLLSGIKDPEYFSRKRSKNVALLKKIKDCALTVTDSDEFNEYCHQTFLDNVVRGGMPVSFETMDGKSSFYLYSRQNGDLERDYHYFVVEPTYLSQGTGHYRSVLQNRRCDTWYFPETDDFNIRLFMNLTQLDGYSPLEVKGTTYTVKNKDAARAWLEGLCANMEMGDSSVAASCVGQRQGLPQNDRRVEQLWKMINRGFTPGEFIMAVEDLGIKLEKEYEAVLGELLKFCEENEVGDRLHLGFWIDHWCYNLDTIETYMMIYPEKIREMMFDRKKYTFYDNPDRVCPRAEKYVFDRGRVRQYDAVFHDEEKSAMIDSRAANKYRVRKEFGKGEILKTTLGVKILCHIANRIATLDPDNIGVEMEANKPGWNDSMSAIAGIFGSSLCHTFELERASKLFLNCLNGLPDNAQIPVFEKLAGFIRKLSGILERRLKSSDTNKRFLFWDESHTVKESYREKIRFGVSGKDEPMPIAELKTFLERAILLIGELYKDDNRDRAFNKDGICYTYLSFEVPKYEFVWEDGEKEKKKLSSRGYPLVKPLEFKAKPIALFLEGPVHFMKAHPERAKEIYSPVKNSNIYDRKLKMYKVCESLADENPDIGRVHAWGSGWIENESVYTHMEYKYLLELIKCGLYDEFYEDIKTGFMCFLDPKVYGRSTLENVSFVVSSSFIDPKMHGQGLQPRLSGVTNEMLNIWILMMAGPRPFFTDADSALKLKFDPKLPEWLFTKEAKTVSYYKDAKLTETEIQKDSVAFRFLGNCLVTYHNPGRKNTYGSNSPGINSMRLKYADGREEIIEGDTLDTPLALDVREGRVDNIHIEM